jgi:hypothetical protein
LRIPRGFDLNVGFLFASETVVNDCAIDHGDPETEAVDLWVRKNSINGGKIK